MRSIGWPGDPAITQPYGCTALTVEPAFPDCPSGHKHTGIDVGLPIGSPLNAPEDCTVAYVAPALLALVGTRCWWFVHIDRVAAGVSVGKRLARGQLACYSGNKVPAGGASTGPHLHLELQDALKAIRASYDANGRLIVPPGALNNPRTSLDPVAALAGRFSAGGGGLDMALDPNDPQVVLMRNLVIQVQNLLLKGVDSFPGYAGAADIPTSAEVLTAIKGLSGGQAALDAIADLKATMQANHAAEISALSSSTSAAVADLKTAIANIKVSGGGLTPDQDEHLHAIELVAEQLEQQFAAGLKVDITAVAKPA